MAKSKSRSRRYDELFMMSGKVLKKAVARRKKPVKSRSRDRKKSSKKLLDKYVSGPLHGYELRYTHLHTGTAKDFVILLGVPFPRI